MSRYSLTELDNFARLLTRRQARKLYEAKTNKEYRPKYRKEFQEIDEPNKSYTDQEFNDDLANDEMLWKDSNKFVDFFDNEQPETEFEEMDFNETPGRLTYSISISIEDAEDLCGTLDDFFVACEDEGYVIGEPSPIDSEDIYSDEEDVNEEEEYDDTDDMTSLEKILDSKNDLDAVYVYLDNEEENVIITFPIDKEDDIKGFLSSLDMKISKIEKIFDDMEQYTDNLDIDRIEDSEEDEYSTEIL